MIIKKILITGISGSGGSYLAEYICNNHPEVKVYGLSRWHSTKNNYNINSIINKIKIFDNDLCDFGSTLRIINRIKPDVIFHLASNANVRSSFDNSISVMNNNINSTLNLFEVVRTLKINPIIQMCSTSEVYGKVNKNKIPINENCDLNPANPYAVSKAAQDLLGKTYYMNHKLKVITTRMFSYLNPRRDDLFATSFAKQIALIELGKRKYLTHGNLNSVRTLIDINDAMRAYWIAVKKGKIGETYNIGGNTILKVGEFLNILKSLSKVNIKTKLDPKLLRPTDVTLQIPNVSKFRKHTGWKPKVPFKESLNQLLNYWRERAKHND